MNPIKNTKAKAASILTILSVSGLLLLQITTTRATTVPSLPPALEQQIAGAEGLSKEILADGTVETVELEQAIRAAVDCMESAGLSVTLHLDLASNAWSIEYSGGPTLQTVALAESVVENCEASHLDLVANVHAFQNRPTQEEFLAKYRQIADCLRSAGVVVKGDTVEAVAAATLTDTVAYDECSRDL